MMSQKMEASGERDKADRNREHAPSIEGESVEGGDLFGHAYVGVGQHRDFRGGTSGPIKAGFGLASGAHVRAGIIAGEAREDLPGVYEVRLIRVKR
jgi:hypothetical protein